MALDWTPWHKVVDLRDDLKSGELSLTMFAADLYEVFMRSAKPVYNDPNEFFALTYATFNLRELAKDVALRLAGKSEKAIRQLTLTYGGGKTHALILLYHLFNDPGALPDLPAVKEVRNHIGIDIPRATVVALPFDKIDVERGMETRAPDGTTRWLKHPWSILAFQLAGDDGLRVLHADHQPAERDSVPAENLMTALLRKPAEDGLPPLILIDEVLMFAREKVRMDPGWRDALSSFFQYLTQAATKVDGCAVVASLLASDQGKADTLGNQIMEELHTILRREQEEGVQPVLKEDVAEILRRRFFKPESITDREHYRQHIVAALKGVAVLDEQTAKNLKNAEDRYVDSFPFHPDLTEVFYAKWTNLTGFQRTRGVLRTFSLALRSAQLWDDSPLVSAGVFLSKPGDADISEAAKELLAVAETEEYEGKRQDWRGILEGELKKSGMIQEEFPGLRHREVEAAVFATFLHSQPIGQKALTRDLLVLLGHTRPDKIELEKALKLWSETSWWLDDEAIQDADTGPDGQKLLPRSWMLGCRPNLKQMHSEEVKRISGETALIEVRLEEAIRTSKHLTAGAAAAGARVHTLPERPSDIEDDAEFHFAVLGPKAASRPGSPSEEARRFLEQTTAADRPRIYRNAVVLAVPSVEGLDAARNQIVDYLAWQAIQDKLRDKDIDPVRAGTLSKNTDGSKKRVPEAIRQAYSVVVTINEKNEVASFRITPGDEPLFTTIKCDPNSRIQETAITPEALLPEGPYELWKEGETSRRAKDLVTAFAQFPHLPKMLSKKAIVDTLVSGCESGAFVLSLTRPDGSRRTFWRETPDEMILGEAALEVVLPNAATLASVKPELLAPTKLTGLWTKPEITFAEVCAFFDGSHVEKVTIHGFEESVPVPKAERQALAESVEAAVKAGHVWLVDGAASLFEEDVPAGLPTDNSILQAPPDAIPPVDITRERLPDAWPNAKTTPLSILSELSAKAGKNLPWVGVRRAIDGALQMRLIERSEESGPWPCDLAGAASVILRVPKVAPPPPPPPPPPPNGPHVAEAELRPDEIQTLAEEMGNLLKATTGLETVFRMRVEVAGTDVGGKLDAIQDVLSRVSDNLRFSK